MMFADTSRGRPYSKDPAVVSFKGKYFLYYSLGQYGDGRPADVWSIGIAQSQDLDHWEICGALGPEQGCEESGLCAPGAIVLGNEVHLFYQTYGQFPRDAICHAVSQDGIHFHRDPTNPVFAPRFSPSAEPGPDTPWNNGRAIDADVIPFRGQLLLYFASRDPAGEIQLLGVAGAPLESPFHRENWTMLRNESILFPTLPWEGACIEAPAVCENNGRLYMFYGGAYNNCPQQIGCAASEDGLRWVRCFDTPFLPNGKPGEWNASESGHPYAFYDETTQKYHLFFQGNQDNGKTWYLSRREFRFSGGIPVLMD